MQVFLAYRKFSLIITFNLKQNQQPHPVMRLRNFFQADSNINALFLLVGPRNSGKNGVAF